MFLNAHGNVRDELMYGDKDTFELAFALAGSHSDFHQMRIWARAALSELKHVRSTCNAPDLFTSGIPDLFSPDRLAEEIGLFAFMECRLFLIGICGCLFAPLPPHRMEQ